MMKAHPVSTMSALLLAAVVSLPVMFSAARAAEETAPVALKTAAEPVAPHVREGMPTPVRDPVTLLGEAGYYQDSVADNGKAVGYLNKPGCGIEYRGLPAGKKVKIRYAALNDAQLTLRVNDGAPVKIAFPATGKWAGEDAYEDVAVPVEIPPGAALKLMFEPGDTPANIDRLDVLTSESNAPVEEQVVTVTPYVEQQFPDKPVLGKFFTKWTYTRKPFPGFAEMKDKLPSPVYDANPDWVRMYWKVWEIVCRPGHRRNPRAGSGFVSPFVDAAFDPWDHKPRVYQWDTCFMTMFYNMAWPLTPGIESLDNFYAHQFPDGEISCQFWQNGLMTDRSMNLGKDIMGSYGDGPWKPVVFRGREKPAQVPYASLDWMNHPLFAWAELEHYRTTGNKARIALVYEPLVHYYESLKTHIRQGNGLYMTDWASMDNSPRVPWLKTPGGNIGGCGVDISCEMVLFARNMETMARMLGKEADAAKFAKEADDTAAIINKLMWDPDKKFYFDLTYEDKRAPVKTIAGFWSLLAGIPSETQIDALVEQLNNPKTFNRRHRVPTCSADEKGFNPNGGYWCGAVWAPTETMVIRGLENVGRHELARAIAFNHLENIGEVFRNTGTVWENYAPDAPRNGRPSQPNFVGWSGLGPVLYFLEFAIGLKPDAANNTLAWDLRSDRRCGCERYRFNGHVADLLATPDGNTWNFRIHSDGEFTLRITLAGHDRTVAVKKGKNVFAIVGGLPVTK